MRWTEELSVSRKKAVLLNLQYCMYRMVDRVHVFHCSHHLPGPALHVPYRHCLIRHLSAPPDLEYLRESAIMHRKFCGRASVIYIGCCLIARRERAELLDNMD